MAAATDELIRRMYEAPPDGFVAARSAAVAEAKKSGDTAAVKQLTALRKPTVAAWLVNLLALRKPELIDQLVELAEALRTAQRTLRGDELRELSTQRRQIVSALVGEARKLAVAQDKGLAGKLPLGEVEATLSAAMSEPEIAEQVRSGRLIRAATYAGFGEVPRPRLRLVHDADALEDAEQAEEEVEEGDDEPAPAARDRALAERRRREFQEKRREFKKELTAAQAAEKRADDQLDKAETAERDAGHAVEDIDNELAELERRRTEAQAEVGRRKLARRTAEREAAAARRRVGDAEAALEDLDGAAPD
ncbi:hypothetical protein [Actinoplanes sp. NBRC 103695]|uniref:hypothetical protein n=1 Tax=Actinoplanes sp. NBRC 103695 TaxID=3032202 RepID=UPI0024A0F83D|nr:hypothetical protein [Actinoplanes sp. NBRC 103695]GLY95626.1 hypothetical protein Acsp02_28810 [Actinoplanes sp. NBRC 103695]